jgi:hypothetical protein
VAKIVQCDCGFVMRGETEDELVANVQKHAREVQRYGDHQGTGPCDDSTGVVAHKPFLGLIGAGIGRGRRRALEHRSVPRQLSLQLEM